LKITQVFTRAMLTGSTLLGEQFARAVESGIEILASVLAAEPIDETVFLHRNERLCVRAAEEQTFAAPMHLVGPGSSAAITTMSGGVERCE